MSKKSLIICIAVLAAMILGISIAVAVLYSGVDEGQSRKGKSVPDQERFLLLPAVPADAVLVACLSDAKDISDNLFSGYPVMAALSDSLSSQSFKSVGSSPMAFSVHYSGNLQTLFVFDTGKASAEPSEGAVALLDFAQANRLYSEYVDCSATITDTKRDISGRSIVVMSDSETLMKSSVRHLEKSVSILDATGFAEASSIASGSDLIFFSNAHSKVFMPAMFAKAYTGNHTFLSTVSQRLVADISKSDESGLYMTVQPSYNNDPAEYMTVLAKSEPGISKVASILPSYTLSAVSLPMKNMDSYISAYQSYMDSKQSLTAYRKKQRDLETRAGIKPEDFFRKLEIEEVAKASFMVGSSIEEVNLLRVGREDEIIFVGTENKSFKDYTPSIHSWPYASFTSSVFGKFFQLKDESCFTYIDGWIVSGSLKAIDSYVSGMALQYTLLEYMADAGQKDMLSSLSSCMVSYFSMTENPAGHTDVFSKNFAVALQPLYKDCDFCPNIMVMTNGKNGIKMNVQLPRLTMARTKAPEFERDTTVVIPQGPFKVKNSGTGRMNVFYQNSHGSICLQEEDGKGLWGVPFKGKLCGTAHNVDYYANGKLQIIFGSGSKIYIIDRLGHYVSGFPVDLGKEILLGPDIYDFNGAKAYNIMVLHKDNTIEMYNLKGKKPASWKSITAPETIKGLPEKMEVGGKTFWLVRTSVQTLIYPFSGGSAITTFKGDEMIRPDSKVEIIDEAAVKVDCYDGKTRTVKLL